MQVVQAFSQQLPRQDARFGCVKCERSEGHGGGAALNGGIAEGIGRGPTRWACSDAVGGARGFVEAEEAGGSVG